MLIDERRFDFLPQSKWKNLSKKDRSKLQSFRSYYGHYKGTLNEIEELKKEIGKKEEKVKRYLSKMNKLNYEIDHLRDDYHFSWSVSKIKKKNYYNLCISRRGHTPKSGGLGGPKKIEDRLRTYYKRNKNKLNDLDRLGWDRFIRSEVNDRSGRNKVRNRIIDMITKDPTLIGFVINRKILFPLKKDLILSSN